MTSSLKNNPYLTPQQIKSWPVTPKPATNADLKKPLRDAIKATNLDHPLQVAGHHFAIGCVALEITQRCNLDCTACYLSDISEAVHDLPLEEILRRIDQIAEHYGPNTNVQVTGGEPSLRKREELIAIIAHLTKRKQRAALFTNGIKVTRALLMDLKAAGLKDVAFHIDMTQERKGYDSEEALNTLRDDYIDRARGLGLQIIFNTTVFDGNINDIEMLSRFFTDRAKDLHLASFQMIADTGRGTIRERTQLITQERIMSLISKGIGTQLNFDFPQIGHLECNRYAKCLVAGDKRISAFTEKDRAFFEKLFPFTRSLFLDRHKPVTSVLKLAGKLINGHLNLLTSGFSYAIRKAYALRYGLVTSLRQPDFITFYIHNFMHAHTLDHERCKACVFMTMTRDGPVSMCVHNAKRDNYILQDVIHPDGKHWHPLKTSIKDAKDLPLKKLKGRARMLKQEHKNKQKLPIEIKGRIGEIETKRRQESKNN